MTMFLVGPNGCSYDGKILKINDIQVPFIYYKELDDFWMPAKPVMRVAGETRMTHFMDRVHSDNKMAFKDLAEAHGIPEGGCAGFDTPPNPDDYTEGKAIWINESGFYQALLGSRKPECKMLQCVLPSIRKTGFYSMNGGGELMSLAAFETSLSKVLKSPQFRETLREEVLAVMSSESTSTMLNDVASQWYNKFLEFSEEFKVSLVQRVCFSLTQKLQDIRDGIIQVITNPTGAFLDALRKAVKNPAIKKTTNADKFPDEQRVSQEEERFAVSLSVVLADELAARAEHFRRSRLPVQRAVPTLTYGAWKKVRSLVGSRCLALRKVSAATKPLLWSNSADAGRSAGGGQHYVYLSERHYKVSGNSHEYIRKVLNQKLKKAKKSPTVEEHIWSLIVSTPPEQWPTSTSCIDSFPIDVAQEKLGVEMDVEP